MIRPLHCGIGSATGRNIFTPSIKNAPYKSPQSRISVNTHSLTAQPPMLRAIHDSRAGLGSLVSRLWSLISGVRHLASGLRPLAACLAALVPLAAWGQGAASPVLIPFQGQVSNQQGQLVASGQYSIIFNLYDVAVGGQPIWTERHSKVGVANGMVNVFLGSITSLTAVDFSQTCYLGITVDVDDKPTTPDPEMVPRQMIIPAFFAKNAERLAGHNWSSILDGAVNDPVNGKIRGDKIADGSISSAKIGDGQITPAKLSTTTVTGSQIQDGTVATVDLANEAVTAQKIANGAVGTAQMVPGLIGFVPRRIDVFRSSGTWIWKPDISRVYVKVIGRGGNGGGSGGSSAPQGGGGGGGYAEGIVDVTANVTISIGETNSFGGVATIYATSGGNGSGQAGGPGGTAGGSAASIILPGGPGQNVSQTQNGTGGMGGASAMGAGGTGAGLVGGTTYLPETNGASYGGGGGGATNVQHNGGQGDVGAVIVYY